MANTYSFEKLIQLLNQNFDVKIIDYNEKKFVTFGRDIYKDSREIDKRKEFTIIKSQYFYRFISSTMVDGYLVERNQETFSTVGEIYKFILKKINDLKSNTYIKQTSIESLNIDSRDLDNEFTSRLTLLKLIGKYDDFIKTIENEIMIGSVGQIQFSDNNKDIKINHFIYRVHFSYATINKRCFADDFYGIDLRIFKDQLMKNLFFIVRNRAYKNRYAYILKPEYV